MAIKIISIEFHKEQIEANESRNAERADMDVSDCALSVWAANSTISAHQYAISCLELAAEHGLDYPIDTFKTLMYEGKEVKSRIVESRFGSSWLIQDDALVAKFGRRFVPIGENSRVQKNLGLSEGYVNKKITPFVHTHHSCIGSAGYNYTIPENN